ncbi:polyprenol monophosphomannose synthase [Luteitalea sp.]|uniref:polyprenol monophosphomannose synthase n=1 Tax=Luteitalea sp. TaxID=2004800 RepID=UPI0025BE7DB7|nr:polyprenol monophosphomannose synthase [Luteitalea sp.]
MTTPPRVLVVTPTYNERDNLPVLVRQVIARGPHFSILVVDDASPDGTGAIADALAAEFPGRVQVMHRTGKRGLGRSYVDALSLAVTQDVDIVCQMDADFSHDPQYLPALVEGVTAGGLDLVIGSRYLHGVSVVNWPLSRLILSTFANRYVRFITGLPARDCTSGYRCWRREALARLPLERFVSDGYAFLVEMLFEAMGAGCRIGEVPIIYVERREGQSKMSKSVILESVFVPWRLVARHPSWRGRRG